MKKVFVIDNYDSFTYNLVHYLIELGVDVTTKRNDQFKFDEINKFQNILISPGPGLPYEAGFLKKTIERYAANKKILGICLGHQAIGEVFGAKLHNLERVYHGEATTIKITDEDIIFKNIPKEIQVGRYHSWTIQNPLPNDLIPTSFDENGEIMSILHRKYNVRGLQFHPESILTSFGKKILQNWLEI